MDEVDSLPATLQGSSGVTKSSATAWFTLPPPSHRETAAMIPLCCSAATVAATILRRVA